MTPDRETLDVFMETDVFRDSLANPEAFDDLPEGDQYNVAQLRFNLLGHKVIGDGGIEAVGKANEWQPYEGPQGGQGWKHPVTDEVRYQEEKPDPIDPDEAEVDDDPIREPTGDESHSHIYRPSEPVKPFVPPGHTEAGNEPDDYEPGDRVFFYDAHVNREAVRGTVTGFQNDYFVEVEYKAPDGEIRETFMDPAFLQYEQVWEEVPTGDEYGSVEDLLDSGYFSFTDGDRGGGGIQFGVFREYMAEHFGADMVGDAIDDDPYHINWYETLQSWRTSGYWANRCLPLWEAAQRATDKEQDIPESVENQREEFTYPADIDEAIDETMKFCQVYFDKFIAGDRETITVYRGISDDLADAARDVKDNDGELTVDPRAMESWSMDYDTAKDYGDVVISREVSARDVAFYAPIIMPSLASTEELTVLGHYDYEIPADDIEIVPPEESHEGRYE